MQCNYVRYQFTFVMDCKPCFNVILMVIGLSCSYMYSSMYEASVGPVQAGFSVNT